MAQNWLDNGATEKHEKWELKWQTEAGCPFLVNAYGLGVGINTQRSINCCMKLQ